MLSVCAKAAKNFAVYVTYLRGLYLLHQNHHWQVKDSKFYGNHLLFQRLYEEVSVQIDKAAEKCIGHFGPQVLNLADQSEYLQSVIQSFEVSLSPNSELALKSSLRAEENFQKISNALYDLLKKTGDLTFGLDDFIMAGVGASEDRCYLLKQNF